jgi:hypothetical protein
MSNLILELFLHNLKLCIDYQHWIHNYNKTIKQFYINTNKTRVLNLIKGGGGTPTSGKVFYHSYLCHGITFMFLSFNTWKIKEKLEPL